MANEMANGFVTIVCGSMYELNKRIKKVQKTNKLLTIVSIICGIYIGALVNSVVKQDKELKKLSDEIKELKSVKGD